MSDLLIQKGTIINGTGATGYIADIAVKDGKIAACREWVKRDEAILAPGGKMPYYPLVVKSGKGDAASKIGKAARQESERRRGKGRGSAGPGGTSFDQQYIVAKKEENAPALSAAPPSLALRRRFWYAPPVSKIFMRGVP